MYKEKDEIMPRGIEDIVLGLMRGVLKVRKGEGWVKITLCVGFCM